MGQPAARGLLPRGDAREAGCLVRARSAHGDRLVGDMTVGVGPVGLAPGDPEEDSHDDSQDWRGVLVGGEGQGHHAEGDGAGREDVGELRATSGTGGEPFEQGGRGFVERRTPGMRTATRCRGEHHRRDAPVTPGRGKNLAVRVRREDRPFILAGGETSLSRRPRRPASSVEVATATGRGEDRNHRRRGSGGASCDATQRRRRDPAGAQEAAARFHARLCSRRGHNPHAHPPRGRGDDGDGAAQGGPGGSEQQRGRGGEAGGCRGKQGAG